MSLQRIALLVGLPILFIFLVQLTFFRFTISPDSSPQKADVIIVFSGSPERVEKAYGLANAGHAPNLIVSWANSVMLKDFDRKYGLRQGVRHIVEDRAQTTFENALFSARIVKDRGFKSVILVTSSFHMPRSFFLMRLMLLGSGVRVHRYGLRAGHNGETNKMRADLICYLDEMMRFWGSIWEGVLYLTKGAPASADQADVFSLSDHPRHSS